MHFHTATTLAALSLSTFTAAAPTPALSTREACTAFPWFIAPFPDSQTCTGTAALFQPTSGLYDSNATSTGCRPLYNPGGPPTSFQSVSINRDACPQQLWQINLYVDAACGTEPLMVRTDSCVASPGTGAVGRFESFKAILLT